MKEIQIQKKRKLIAQGLYSTALVLPMEFLEILEVKKGDDVALGLFEGKKGKFMAIWKEK